jgi:hypothetical protein
MFQKDISVTAFGKIVFIPKDNSIPHLPEMNLLFLDEKEERGDIFPYRAVCIDLEIDACGNSVDEAWVGLKNSLTIYIESEKNAVSGSVVEAAKKITQTAFSSSSQKDEYISIYRQAKLKYTIRNIESDKPADPIEMGKKRLEMLATENGSIRFVINELRVA